MKIEKLSCDLSREEIEQRSQTLAETIKQHAAAEEEKRELTKELKEKIDDLQTQIDELAGSIREKKEKRPVEVIERSDHKRAVVETVRTDTKAVIWSRAMTVEELADARQVRLWDPSKKKDEKGQTTEAEVKETPTKKRSAKGGPAAAEEKAPEKDSA